jgi:hypothetical protein
MALGLLGPIACSQTIVEGEPAFMLSPLPPDVTSGLTALEVDMRPAAPPTGPPAAPPTGQPFQVPPSAQELQAIVASSSLATWPELAPLATTVLVTALGVSFRSTAPAADGWYALVMSKQPGWVKPDGTSFHFLADGRSLARVRVGSAPILRNESVCPKADGRTAVVVVAFSEEVEAATTSTMPLTIEAGPTASPIACATDRPPLAGAPQQSFEFVCATSLAPTDVITVSVKEGLLSRGGVAVPVAQRIAAVNTFRLNVLMTECSSLLFEP